MLVPVLNLVALLVIPFKRNSKHNEFPRLRYEYIKLPAFKLIPHACSFTTSKSCGIQPKALDMSFNKASVIKPLSEDFLQFSKPYQNKTWAIVFPICRYKLRQETVHKRFKFLKNVLFVDFRKVV